MQQAKQLGVFFPLIMFTIVVNGCSTPQSIRTLSNEQVKAQEGYLESQTQYFAVIEKYVDAQVAATEFLISAATKELNEKFKKKALGDLDPNDKSKSKAALDELANAVLKEQQSDQQALASIKEAVANLKELHRQMLASLSMMVAAQKKLNEYMQLERADEQAVSQLLATVGVEKNKVEAAVASATSIFRTIENTINTSSKQ